MNALQSGSKMGGFHANSVPFVARRREIDSTPAERDARGVRLFVMRLKRVFRYTQELGLINAMRIVWQKVRGCRVMTLRMPGIRNPLYCRSSDVFVMLEVFGGKNGRVYDPALRGKPKLIVDAGANVGFLSAHLANLFPDARIVSIEPDRANRDIFHQNCAGYPNVQLIEAALWCRPGYVRIENPGDASFLLRVTEDENAGIPAVTIPEILASEGAECIDILKLDVEGSEKMLFSHNNHWLRNVRVMIVELHDQYENGCREAMMAAIAGRRFQHSRVNGLDLVEFFDV